MPTGLTSAIVVNSALEFIAAQTQITALNDGSPAANAALIIYTPTVELMLRLMEPDFARFTATLSLSTAVTPPVPWTYEYIYPSDCLRLLQVRPASGSYNVNDPQPVRANVASDQLAIGTILFSVNPSNGDTITLGGVVWTFVSGAASGNQTHIGGTTAFTIATLINDLNASGNATILLCAYGESGGPTVVTLTLTYKAAGSAGTSFTIAASAATPSGATLTGTGLKVILTNQVSALANYISSLVTEPQWDAAFTDAVVRRLANPLAMALSGRPDFAKEILEESSRSAAMADAVDESAVRPR